MKPLSGKGKKIHKIPKQGGGKGESVGDRTKGERERGGEGKREMERERESRPRVHEPWKRRRARGLAGGAIMATARVQSEATNFFLPIRH